MNEVFNSYCVDKLKELPDNFIDSIVTDPPYGIGFMSKSWDELLPDINVWYECLRILKPGGHMVVACGTRTYHRMAVNIEDAGFEIRDIISWIYGSGMPKGQDVGKNIYKKYNEHNNFYGWNSTLKPATELWTLARKPLSESSITKNVYKWGAGAINIDDNRIEINPEVDDSRLGGKGSWKTDKMAKQVYEGGYSGKRVGSSDKGRYPANIVHDGSDEVINTFPEAPGQQGDLKNHNRTIESPNGIYGKQPPRYDHPKRNDDGSAARFFYCAKATQKERGDANNHPTVKPLSLMEFLVKLVTPKSGVVLDPYAGSGTTLLAAIKHGYNYIGIERKKEYFNIINDRIENLKNNIDE